jgi:hypothetical protein
MPGATTRVIVAFTARPEDRPRARPRRQTVALDLPEDAKDIACAVRVPVEKVPPPRNEEKDYVQVLLPGSSDPYVYRCAGADIGDRVAVNRGGPAPDICRVVGIGRGGHTGPTKTATLIED